ncbi:MerR family DNA-binding transcriptional regulator [Paenibacillus sp. SC116]|uniref:MerR family DNA-binding transcriptional regulator n=1 Tax=Paenibacillus sp. SC116 TaxID=2968986 RepID=UPI00215A283C|nr:MerR family DNA-binding transcriptional regulator [Paenibacillus sp. SC116]MCR8842420.1 MerR family DNA-binding transcriptional regulator [Paenibacillus sp. SC116]
MRPKKLASKFIISPSTIRNYETKGLIPAAERSANGYRVYTNLHEAYLACIQAMAPAFGMEITTEVLNLLQQEKPYEALWVVRQQEVALYEEKARLKALIVDIRMYTKENQTRINEKCLTINEVSEVTQVPKSAIRYWEQAGYVTADRDPTNRYRVYSGSHLFKIRLLQLLQNSVYSEDTVHFKQMIASVEHTDLPQILNLAEHIRSYFDQIIESQMRGISYLYPLLRLTQAPE